MFDSTLESPGEWFSCVNIGDDHIADKNARRKDKDLLIPGHSLVEIIGIRNINDNSFMHEVRLPVGDTIGENYAFTGHAGIQKGYQGRMKFAPAMCRYEGDESDTEKIFGRYVRPRTSKLSASTLDKYEQLFGDGTIQTLIGDPKGHLKLPTNAFQRNQAGWNVHGIYKYKTGIKKEDDDQTKNLLAYVAPAAQPTPPSIVFLTKEDITNQVFQTGSVAVDLLEYVDPRSANWNHKFLLDFAGAFGHEYLFQLVVHRDGAIGRFEIQSDGSDIQAALESVSWIGEGNVKVHSPGTRTGRFIIEFIGDLAGTRVPDMSWQRIIDIDPDPPGNLKGNPSVPPIIQYPLYEYDYRILPGVHSVQITPASKPLSHYQRWHGSGGYFGGGYYNDYNLGWGYYGGGDYGYFGGYGGGPLGYFGGGYHPGTGAGIAGGLGNYGPYGVLSSHYLGPFNIDADGNTVDSGSLETTTITVHVYDRTYSFGVTYTGYDLAGNILYNSAGYNIKGYDIDGYDPGGFDVNGLDADGKSWGYYGVWGHLHLSTAHSHRNDHGIVNRAAHEVFQYTAAGSFGIANWAEGGAYVVVELEHREFWMHTESTPEPVAAYY